MADSRRGRPTAADEPLLRALTWAGRGFPPEVWATVATALAPGAVTYSAADVTAFAGANPDQVYRFDMSTGPRFSRNGDSLTTAVRAAMSEPSVVRALDGLAGPVRVEDDIAVALVTRYAAATGRRDQHVRDYLHNSLPDWCADGTGRGLEALRTLPAGADTDRLVGRALLRRADREDGPAAREMRAEAVERLLAAGEQSEAAEALRHLGGGQRRAGDFAGALEALRRAEAIYRELSVRGSYYDRFVALTLLAIGAVYRDAGRRRPAVAATRQAYRLFSRIAVADHRFDEEVALARRQLRDCRWSVPLRRR